MKERRRRKQAGRASDHPENRSFGSTPDSSPSANLARSKPAIWVTLALIAVNVIVYAAVRHYEFAGDWDDLAYVTQNPNISKGLTWEGIAWAFTSGYAANWHPLTWLSHMLDIQLFGMNAGAHHVTNLVLHIANTVLLFGFLLSATGALGRSAFVAALFAVHPLHVESVAWVAERKDVLSTLFWMLTVCAYVAYVRRQRPGRYVAVVLLFGLGLMAKPMLVTLPFVLLLLDYWPLGRVALGDWPAWRPLVREKIPLLALAAASSVVTFLVQRHGGAVNSLDALPLNLRLENAAVAYVGYIGKMLWPAGLTTLYPFVRSLPGWQVAGSTLVLAGVSALTVKLAPRRPYVAVGWLWYLGMLVPVIGLVQVGAQSMADRYTYVPLIGLFIIVAWGFTDLLANWQYRRIGLPAAAALIVGACVVTARAQVAYWANTFALWSHAVEVTSDNYRAHAKLGNLLSQRGDSAGAIIHYSEALRINPKFLDMRNNLANALARQGKVNEAMEQYTQALRIVPEYASAHNGLGALLADQGRVAEAIDHYRQALQTDPNFAQARNNLAAALAGEGKVDEAIQQLTAAVRVEPNSTEFHYNLGLLLKTKGDTAEAARHFQTALTLNPKFLDARRALDNLRN